MFRWLTRALFVWSLRADLQWGINLAVMDATLGLCNKLTGRVELWRVEQKCENMPKRESFETVFDVLSLTLLIAFFQQFNEAWRLTCKCVLMSMCHSFIFIFESRVLIEKVLRRLALTENSRRLITFWRRWASSARHITLITFSMGVKRSKHVHRGLGVSWSLAFLLAERKPEMKEKNVIEQKQSERSQNVGKKTNSRSLVLSGLWKKKLCKETMYNFKDTKQNRGGEEKGKKMAKQEQEEEGQSSQEEDRFRALGTLLRSTNSVVVWCVFIYFFSDVYWLKSRTRFFWKKKTDSAVLLSLPHRDSPLALLDAFSWFLVD